MNREEKSRAIKSLVRLAQAAEKFARACVWVGDDANERASGKVRWSALEEFEDAVEEYQVHALQYKNGKPSYAEGVVPPWMHSWVPKV